MPSIPCRIIASILTPALVAGCSSAARDGMLAPPAPIVLRAAKPVPHKSFLYVGNAFGSDSTLVVYPLHGSKPLRTIRRQWNVYAMAIDPWGDIYTTDGFPSGGNIIAYHSGGRSRLLEIGDDADGPLAFDSAGNLYVYDQLYIREFKARSILLLRKFGSDAYDTDALAFDGDGNLYAAQLATSSSGGGKGLVKVYPPGKDDPSRTITEGVNTPVAMLFDPSGDLYVANCPSCYDRKTHGSVAEYAPGSATPSRVLTADIYNPVALALGNNGQLFVANRRAHAGNEKPGWITVYPASGTKPLRRITNGIEGVHAIAVDAKGYLYAANSWYGKYGILVFTPDGSRLVRTITDGVHTPYAIAIGG